ncbi:hypothetical protein DFQ27_005268 [Actinomortierella ambigua]|uniref:Uncharacterized protein n=1 Tax=Actinomortierella ambigua TaxID=1343610 RepID=A0A9P6Q1X1_9FUNG|nr:hypothetical protein DFQ27_005268 [Actinomortierella ambigua]
MSMEEFIYLFRSLCDNLLLHRKTFDRGFEMQQQSCSVNAPPETFPAPISLVVTTSTMEPTQTTLVDTGSFQTIQGCSQQGTMVSIQVPIYQFVADPTEYSSPIDRRPFHVIIDRHIRSNFPHMQRLLVGSRQVRMLALADEV